MELSAGTFHHLYQLFGHGPGGLTDAHTQLLAIPRDALVCWLRGAVANPGAERHLLRLFDAACGAVTGQGRAYRCFYRELAAHLRPELKRQIIEAGEISQVTEIAGSSVVSWRDPVSGGLMPVVYKKMPPLSTGLIQRNMSSTIGPTTRCCAIRSASPCPTLTPGSWSGLPAR